jgi:hypothetical protein
MTFYRHLCHHSLQGTVFGVCFRVLIIWNDLRRAEDSQSLLTAHSIRQLPVFGGPHISGPGEKPTKVSGRPELSLGPFTYLFLNSEDLQTIMYGGRQVFGWSGKPVDTRMSVIHCRQFDVTPCEGLGYQI